MLVNKLIGAMVIILLTNMNSIGEIFDSQPVIILCAFGTSTPAIKTYDFIEEQIREAFPDYEIRWAFTAQFIINKLRKQGKEIYSLSEVYEKLRHEGKVNVCVQSLHITQGGEFRQILSTPSEGLNVRYGLPLLSTRDDYRKVLNAIKEDFIDPAKGINVVVVHGNRRHLEYNYSLVKLDKMLRSMYSNVVVGSVEGLPGAEKAIEDAINYTQGKSVNFVPCMLVSGNHIENDIMGEESWRVRIGKRATLSRSLGYNKKIIDIFIEHIKFALEQF